MDKEEIVLPTSSAISLQAGMMANQQLDTRAI
jgi:hypothetical protein